MTRSVAGVRLGPGASAYQRIISSNPYVHDEHEDNPGQEKEGWTVSSINITVTVADALIISVKLLAALT